MDPGEFELAAGDRGMGNFSHGVRPRAYSAEAVASAAKAGYVHGGAL
jgi:hypothetical protein